MFLSRLLTSLNGSTVNEPLMLWNAEDVSYTRVIQQFDLTTPFLLRPQPRLDRGWESIARGTLAFYDISEVPSPE